MTEPNTDPYFYAHEKLSRTVEGLAGHRAGIVERLTAVYGDQGHRIPSIDGGEAEPELAARIEKFHADMQAALPTLTESRAEELVDVVLDLNDRVGALYWQRRNGA